MKGLRSEAKLSSNQLQYFRDFVGSFEGMYLMGYAFARISPALMIAFSLINFGISPLLSLKYSAWMENILVTASLKGAVLGIVAIILGQLAIAPYRYLLHKSQQLV